MGRETCAEGEIDPEDAETFIPFEQMPVFRDHKAQGAGRFVALSADIGDAGAGIVPWQYEWK
jgi:hypothetical protein